VLSDLVNSDFLGNNRNENQQEFYLSINSLKHIPEESFYAHSNVKEFSISNSLFIYFERRDQYFIQRAFWKIFTIKNRWDHSHSEPNGGGKFWWN
jgi:hypothetical protein